MFARARFLNICGGTTVQRSLVAGKSHGCVVPYVSSASTCTGNGANNLADNIDPSLRREPFWISVCVCVFGYKATFAGSLHLGLMHLSVCMCLGAHHMCTLCLASEFGAGSGDIIHLYCGCIRVVAQIHIIYVCTFIHALSARRHFASAHPAC